MTNAGQATVYACRCLNVRVRPQPMTAETPADALNDSEYKSVYVADEGVSIVSRPDVKIFIYAGDLIYCIGTPAGHFEN